MNCSPQYDLFAAAFPIGVPKEVCDLFEQLALRVIAQGWSRYSADALLHKIRWEMQIERGDADFKCNDHWTAPLARWFMARHPQHEGFFELRKLRGALALVSK